MDDSYNASPGSVIAALDLLAGMPGGGSAVLGEMLERVFTTGTRWATSGSGRRGGSSTGSRHWRWRGRHRHRPRRRGARWTLIEAADRPAALATLESDSRDGDVVLVKASRGVELDLLVEDLVAALEARPR